MPAFMYLATSGGVPLVMTAAHSLGSFSRFLFFSTCLLIFQTMENLIEPKPDPQCVTTRPHSHAKVDAQAPQMKWEAEAPP